MELNETIGAYFVKYFSLFRDARRGTRVARVVVHVVTLPH